MAIHMLIHKLTKVNYKDEFISLINEFNQSFKNIFLDTIQYDNRLDHISDKWYRKIYVYYYRKM